MWETEIDMVCECSKAPKETVVYITSNVSAKITTLMELYPEMEWLAYLIGDDNLVEDLYIPKQLVTQASVTDVVSDSSIRTIGVIHSHNNMDAFFSKTDTDFINENNNISICVSHKNMVAQIRMKVPCGALKIVPAKVRIFDKEFDKDNFIKSISGQISELKSEPVPSFTSVCMNNLTGRVYNPLIVDNDTQIGYTDVIEYEDDFQREEEHSQREEERFQKEVEEHFQRLEENAKKVSKKRRIKV